MQQLKCCLSKSCSWCGTRSFEESMRWWKHLWNSVGKSCKECQRYCHSRSRNRKETSSATTTGWWFWVSPLTSSWMTKTCIINILSMHRQLSAADLPKIATGDFLNYMYDWRDCSCASSGLQVFPGRCRSSSHYASVKSSQCTCCHPCYWNIQKMHIYIISLL